MAYIWLSDTVRRLISGVIVPRDKVYTIYLSEYNASGVTKSTETMIGEYVFLLYICDYSQS
jgi:hypothetical protein